MTRKKRTTRMYPKFSLTESLQVAQSIQDNNAGQPYSRLDLAKSIEKSPTSSGFRDLITSSGKFGLTEGGYSAKRIALTKLGSSIVAPRNDDEKNAAMREALLSIGIFKTFLDRFDNQKLPKSDLLENTLASDFKVPPDQVKDCYDIIMKNLKELNLLDDIRGNLFVRLDRLASSEPQDSTLVEEIESEDFEDFNEIEEEVETEPTTVEETITLPKQNKIFIIHGKNRKPLEQLKEILDGFKVPYSVAIDEPHGGRPISLKVSELMRECTSAIVIFTADEKYQDSEGNESFKPSDNTVYELGAAGVLYGNKIMILKEEGVSLASDFSDLGYIKFEKDKLTAKAMELVKELINLDLVEISAK